MGLYQAHYKKLSKTALIMRPIQDTPLHYALRLKVLYEYIGKSTPSVATWVLKASVEHG